MAIKTYRVKPRATFGAAGKYKPGDLVQLEEKDAAGFLDKLALVEDEQTEKNSPSDIPPEMIPYLRSDLVPNELKLIPSDEKEQDESGEGFKLTGEELLPDQSEEKPKVAKPKTQRKKNQ